MVSSSQNSLYMAAQFPQCCLFVLTLRWKNYTRLVRLRVFHPKMKPGCLFVSSRFSVRVLEGDLVTSGVMKLNRVCVAHSESWIRTEPDSDHRSSVRVFSEVTLTPVVLLRFTFTLTFYSKHEVIRTDTDWTILVMSSCIISAIHR